MFKFYLMRSSRDLLGHVILILIPILLIGIFNFIYSANMIQTGAVVDMVDLSTVLTIGFALTFQIYAAALSFETLAQDFLSPMYDRLLATPTSPRKMIMSIIFTSIIVSFLQTLVIIVFSIFILKAKFESLFAILFVLLLSVVVHQLIGATILFLSKKVKTANAITILYGTIAPVMIGLYFPLPELRIFELMKSYLTPISLARTAILGIINQNYSDVLIGVISLALIAVILFILLKPLSRKVIS